MYNVGTKSGLKKLYLQSIKTFKIFKSIYKIQQMKYDSKNDFNIE